VQQHNFGRGKNAALDGLLALAFLAALAALVAIAQLVIQLTPIIWRWLCWLARAVYDFCVYAAQFRSSRGQSYRATFELSGEPPEIPSVERASHVNEQVTTDRVTGLRPEIRLEIESWGPEIIRINKKILAALGRYDGTVDSTVDAKFALAAQSVYDHYISRCRAGKIKGSAICDCVQILANTEDAWVPRVTAVLYELSRRDLRQEAGKLSIGQ
jgi:hypothetical protein